ncbi:MAG: TerC family protein [Bacilli bacterium]
MDTTLLLEYGWVLLILIGLEGLLAADNALVLAIMVKHLSPERRKKALFYGLLGAFVFRFGSLFIISYLVDIWQIQAIGAAYLFLIFLNHMFRKFVVKREEHEEKKVKEDDNSTSGFIWTVVKVELADIAFAVDSILAAVALSVSLPKTGLGNVGSMDIGPFTVVLLGGIIGLVIMRFAANQFVTLLETRPSLETAAFCIVGWVGVKLAIITLAHPKVGILSEHFAHGMVWKTIFWVVLLTIFILGLVIKPKNVEKEHSQTA